MSHAAVVESTGAVFGAPRRWLRVEGGTLVAAALVGFGTTGRSWWLVPLLVLIPDLSMAGFLVGTRAGARAYNVAHATSLPAVVAALGWWQDRSLVLAVGLIWLAHIGVDRVVGYGLKYDDHFGHTHLGSSRARRGAA